MDTESDASEPRRKAPGASAWILTAIILMLLGGLVAFNFLRPSASPPPKEIAGDALLVRGRVVYLDRCASCHGPLGRGDGPTARGLSGPPVGDLSDDKWKHGDAPEQVIGVIRGGVKETAMAGWNRVISDDSLRAVTAYVYYLAGRDVPPALREK